MVQNDHTIIAAVEGKDMRSEAASDCKMFVDPGVE